MKVKLKPNSLAKIAKNTNLPSECKVLLSQWVQQFGKHIDSKAKKGSQLANDINANLRHHPTGTQRHFNMYTAISC